MRLHLNEYFSKHLFATVESLQIQEDDLPEAFTTTILTAATSKQNITRMSKTMAAKIAIGDQHRIMQNGRADAAIIEAAYDTLGGGGVSADTQSDKDVEMLLVRERTLHCIHSYLSQKSPSQIAAMMHKAFLFLLALLSQNILGGAMFMDDMGDDVQEEETSFMQVGMTKPVTRPRRTGRQAQAAMMEEVEEDDEKTIMFQSSMKKTGVNESPHRRCLEGPAPPPPRFTAADAHCGRVRTTRYAVQRMGQQRAEHDLKGSLRNSVLFVGHAARRSQKSQANRLTSIGAQGCGSRVARLAERRGRRPRGEAQQQMARSGQQRACGKKETMAAGVLSSDDLESEGCKMIQFILLISRQGKTRLKKWFVPCAERDQFRTIKEVSSLILNRSPKVCNFLEWRDYKLCYKRYASLFFIACVENTDNELLALETVHHFVECLDRYFGNVCELDLIFNFHKAYYILDEILISGELQESSKRAVLHHISEQDAMMQENEQAKRKG
eukprot:s6389_g2.t1